MTARGERGAVLVEFALVALVLSLLFAVAIEFGRLMYSAQALQDVARLMARELAVTPLPPDVLFDDPLGLSADPSVLEHPLVLQRIFDPALLVVDTTGWTDTEFEDFIHDPNLPVVNRALLPLMMFEQVGDTRLWRYPGALLSAPASPTGFAVGIPRVTARDADGVETIAWEPVVQEIVDGHFSVACPQTPCGIVALRVNYPYQAGALTAFQPSAAGPFEPNADTPIVGDDTGVTVLNPAAAPGALLPDDEGAVGPYVGPYGLGRQFAYARTVRPFRRLLSAQAIYRREVFQ